MRRPGHRFFGWIAVLTITAWLVASNHCSLAADFSKSSDSSCCSSKEVPAPGMQMFCGDELTSPLPSTASAPVVDLVFLKPAWVEFSVLSPVSFECFEEPASGAGPPDAFSFFECFVSRRLLAQGPPNA